MASNFTNKSNIPFVVAAWLTLDEYDYDPNENTISATTIIKPIRQIILQSRVPPKDAPPVDVTDLLTSQLGNAVHNEIERFWRNPINIIPAAKRLGLPLKRASRIAVNASQEWHDKNPDAVKVQIEYQRKKRKVNGMTITGRSDIVWDGEVMDNKVTTVFTWIMGLNHDYYSQQGSIYKWIDPDTITSDHTTIIHFFRDYRGFEAVAQKKYPPSPVMATRFPLAPLDEVQEYLEWKVDQLFKYRDAEDSEIPECDDEDLWMEPTVWKYYKNPEAYEQGKRCTKRFESDNAEIAAKKYLKTKAKGEGIIVEVKGKAKACGYCDARVICEQYKRLEKEGLIA